MAEIRILITADGLKVMESGDFAPTRTVCRVLRKKITYGTAEEVGLLPADAATMSREYELVGHSGRVLIYEEKI
jgi:hypothetical protein